MISLCVLNSCAITDDIKHAIEVHTINGQKEIVIVVPTYNNSRQDICIKNITSLIEQDYDNFHVYVVNDCSTDDTLAKLKTFLSSHPRAGKVTLIDNKKRVGAMANYYAVIHAIPDHVIVLNVDGDDWLSGSDVLAYINDVYTDERIWLTYGQYLEYPHKTVGFCAGYPAQVILQNSFRKHGLPISHLRTYYAWLFKRLKKEDLMYNGEFVQATCDKVMMVPMVEMTGGRFRCITDILYIYNAINPISDMRIYGHMQGLIRDRLFNMKPYQPLAEPIVDFATDSVG
jgi:glycosyltransferase involved in cell wall biosynthesis